MWLVAGQNPVDAKSSSFSPSEAKNIPTQLIQSMGYGKKNFMKRHTSLTVPILKKLKLFAHLQL